MAKLWTSPVLTLMVASAARINRAARFVETEAWEQILSASMQVSNKLASAHGDSRNKSRRVLYEAAKNAHEVKHFGNTSTRKGESPGKNVGDDLQTRSSTFVQVRNGNLLVLSSKLGFSSSFLMFLICSFIMFIVLALFGMIQYQKSNGKQYQLDHAILELRSAAQQAVQHALQSTEINAWRHTLAKIRDLRESKFNRNHPLYRTIEAHMDEPGVQDQLQSLFSELSEGNMLLSVEQLNFMFANFHLTITNLTTGSMTTTISPASAAYPMWLTSVIDQPLTYYAFVSIFVLFWVVRLQGGIIRQRGDGSTQSEKKEDLWHLRFEYCVEIHGHAALSTSFTYGNFQRLGAKLYMDREVNVQTFSNDS